MRFNYSGYFYNLEKEAFNTVKNEFENKIVNQQYQEDECNKLYKKIFFSNEKIISNQVTSINYIVQGQIKKIPPSLIYKDLISLKNKIKKSLKPMELFRKVIYLRFDYYQNDN